jgi:hypothetical protein
MKRKLLYIIISVILISVLYIYNQGKLLRHKELSIDALEHKFKIDSIVEASTRTAPDNNTPDILFDREDIKDFAVFINDLWYKDKALIGNLDLRLNLPAQAVYIALRSKGRRIADIWECRGTTAEALALAVARVKSRLKGAQIKEADVLEISLGYDFKRYFLDRPKSRRSFLFNINRGLWGIEVVYKGFEKGVIVERFSPTYIVASNRSHGRIIDLFRQKHGIEEADFIKNSRLSVFQAEQILVYLKESPKAFLTERGNIYVSPGMVSRESVAEFAGLAGQWLCNNVHQEGRMTYKYWPSSGTESTANNMIRQWMATTALIRFGHAENNSDIYTLAEKNIDYNISSFYTEYNGFGAIERRNQVKLGAVALAALAIMEHPRRKKWLKQEAALQGTIESLWREDGSMVSFFKPEGDMRFQNFYPGEALLYWALLYEREPDDGLLERFMKSFEYYREWHLKPENRNPAFIPWHTQAYYIIWKHKGYQALQDFIFEMNDWLLSVQQWPQRARYPDTSGRFYDPRRPFGPPHASSTGVYLEGLIDAFELARRVGDKERLDKYRRAINRGLRSLLQLQFADSVDMYYVSDLKRSYVKGGLRTTVYNNEIRCDNIQHGLMAVLKILNIFEKEDFCHY